MDQIDAIRMIGDALTEIDVAAGRLSPSDPNCIALLDRRDRLDKQQRLLVKKVFDDNTAAFKDAAAHLEAVNADLRKSIQNIEHVATFLADVTKFLDAATSLVSSSAKLA